MMINFMQHSLLQLLAATTTPPPAPAYRPFLDPIDALQSSWLWFAIPLALCIAMVYKAVRLPHMHRYWKQVTKMTLQIIGAMILLAVVSYVVVQVVLPLT